MSGDDGGLARVLKRRDVLALAFGAMIGWGWVVLSGDWITAAGSMGAMLAFVLGGAVVLLIGLTYSELTAAMPEVGGEHVFALRALGPTASFVCTWAVILGYVAVVAFEAVALPTVLEYLFPAYRAGLLWNVAGWDVHATWALVGIGGSVLVCAVNYFGVRSAALLQLLFTVLIAGVGVLLICGSLVSPSAHASNMEPLLRPGMQGVFSVLIMTPFFFLGFNVIPQAAEEIDLPHRAIGGVLVLSVALAVAWYVLVILGVARALSPAALGASQLATADAMAALFGSPWAGKLLVLGGVAGIITSWNGFYLGASRAIYAMARSGMLPSVLAKLHPRYQTPTNAVVLVGVLSGLAPLFGRKALVWLVNAGGLGIVVAWVGVALSFLVLRYREPKMARPFRVRHGKLVGLLAVILSVGLMLLYLPGSAAALLWPYEWAIVIVWTLMGVGFYAGCRPQRAAAKSGPVRDCGP